MFEEDKDFFPHILASVAAVFALSAGFIHATGKPAPQAQALPAVPAAHPALTNSAPLANPVCAILDRPEEMAKMLPGINEHFGMMASLPLSGKPVLDKTARKDVNMEVCAVPAIEGKSGRATRNGIEIVQGADATTTWHETFHYRQELDNPANIVMRGGLTEADSAFYFMLTEATAAAYELVVEKEAANRGMTLPPVTKAGASASSHMRGAFRDAYEAAYTLHASRPGIEREQLALSAGGQAAVRYLMDGNDAIWSMGYKLQTVENTLNMYKNMLDSGVRPRTGCESGYEDIRNYRNYSLGEVSGGVTITPPEYYGPDAGKVITRFADKMEFKVPAPALCIRAAKPVS